VATEALHDSVERFPEPACHPGTREKVIHDLIAWSLDTASDSTLLWLYGSAGAGKSAIAQAFAGECQRQSRLGASFFFKRRHATRGQWNRLFPTLAYQLAKSFSDLQMPIQDAIESDKLIVGRAMPLQFRKLFVAPLQQVPSNPSLPVIVIDGLDECEDHRVQQEILRLILDAIRLYRLPVRILVASRPEPHLREVLESDNSYDMCRHLVFSGDQAAYEDIRTYLSDEFARIRQDHSGRGMLLVDTWPTETEITHLVKKSSRMFIYASTVIRFIDNEYSDPAESLNSVLNLDPQSTTPLDDLYSQIISALPNAALLVRVLHIITIANAFDPEEIDAVLALQPAKARLALRGLHSLLSIPPMRKAFGLRRPIKALHASLADFLVDPARSKKLCISTPKLDLDLIDCVMNVISTSVMDQDMKVNYFVPDNHDCLFFFRQNTSLTTLPLTLIRLSPSDHLINSLRREKVQRPSLEQIFLTPQFLRWLRVGSLVEDC
jgi:hypothetical protein